MPAVDMAEMPYKFTLFEDIYTETKLAQEGFNF